MMKVKTPSGWQEFEGIRKTFKKTAKISLSNGKEIRASLDHRFIINHEEVLCRSLKPGQLIYGNVSVVSVSLFKEEEKRKRAERKESGIHGFSELPIF